MSGGKGKVSPKRDAMPLPDDRGEAPGKGSKGKVTRGRGKAIDARDDSVRATGDRLNRQDMPIAQKKRERLNYPQSKKLQAVTFALMLDEPCSQESIDYARRLFDSPKIDASTISKWIKEFKGQVVPLLPANKPPAQIIETTIQDTLAALGEAKNLYLARLRDPDVVADTKALPAATVFGILSDKEEKINGLSDDDVKSLKQIKHYCSKLGYQHSIILRDMIGYLAGLSNQQEVTQLIQAETK